mmetsp:Transcript_26933/g.23776  ORF Transcript_26933/g.23776 Transcript_26933/m.23776 type:complete len:152 (+) Transcript_26933:26-481(+)
MTQKISILVLTILTLLCVLTCASMNSVESNLNKQKIKLNSKNEFLQTPSFPDDDGEDEEEFIELSPQLERIQLRDQNNNSPPLMQTLLDHQEDNEDVGDLSQEDNEDKNTEEVEEEEALIPPHKFHSQTESLITRLQEDTSSGVSYLFLNI